MTPSTADPSPAAMESASLGLAAGLAAELAPAAPVLEAELELVADDIGAVDDFDAGDEVGVKDDAVEEVRTEDGNDVVAKLIDVLADASAQNWLASPSAGERLDGHPFAIQDVREALKAVTFVLEQKQLTSTMLSQPASAMASSRQSSTQEE